MNPPYLEKHPDGLSSFFATGIRTLHNPNRQDLLTATEGAHARGPVEFVYDGEEEFALMLDEYEISWQYKPRTFAVEWDEEGNFVDSFTPGFYLPDLDLYVELGAPVERKSVAKAQKVRLLRQQQPRIRIELLSGASAPELFESPF